MAAILNWAGDHEEPAPASFPSSQHRTRRRRTPASPGELPPDIQAGVMMVAGLRHALDDEVPKAGDIHLDAAGDAEAPRSFGRVVNLRQRILQQQVIGAEDPSLDREALRIHEQSTVPGSALARQSKTPLSMAI